MLVVIRGRFTENRDRDICVNRSRRHFAEGFFWPRLSVLLAFVLFFSGIAYGQSATSGASVPSTSSPSPIPSPSPTPIPLTDITAQAETVQGELRELDTRLSPEPLVTDISEELPMLTREIQARQSESAGIQTSSPSLETLRTVRASWQYIRETLSGWKRDLSRRANQLDEAAARLSNLITLWELTLAQTSADQAPIEMRQQIEALVADIRAAQGRNKERQEAILTLQTRIAEQESQVTEALASLRRAEAAAVDQLFVRGSVPLWRALSQPDAGQVLAQNSQESFSTQATALGTYAVRKSITLLAHACLTAILIALLYRVHQRVRSWADGEPGAKYAAHVFESPIATAVLISLFASGWLYPQAPRLWWTIIGAMALVPAVFVLRRLLEGTLSPVLSALVGFYLMDQLRAVTATLPLVSRLLFLVEMMGGIAFLLWLSQPGRLEEASQNEGRSRLRTAVRVVMRGAMTAFIVALVANILGYVSLATLLGDGILRSAYVAVILYALFRTLDGLIFSGLRLPLLARLGFVQRHHDAVRHALRRGLKWMGILVWTLFTLELFALRAPLVERLRAVLAANLTVGSITVSVGNVFTVVFTVWAAFFVSRVVRFLLEEDVYPRFHLARGLPYAISTMLHYTILLLGFFLAMAAMGVDMTKFTILAGAFGVGLGFGMQNIVSNFVSGLILLFERPIKVGDVIQMDDAAGVVERIGIRASVVRTSSGSNVLVPNSKFISDRVTNWTFIDNLRTIKIPVSVSSDTDPERVIHLLTETAAVHPHVLAHPPPQALLVSFDGKALNVELSASTDRVEEWEQVRSELVLAVRATLAKEEIKMA